MRTFVDALPGMVWTVLADGRAEFVNRRWCEYTGLREEEMSGHGWQAAVHPHDLPEFIRSWNNMQQTGEPAAIELRIRRFDGEHRWFSLRFAPTDDDAGDAPRWCGIAASADEHRAGTEEALHKARAELAYVTRVMTLGVLTASIAHEVNQPLSGIITNASTCLLMLDCDPPNLDGARATAQRTLRDGNRAAEVIQHLRALFARTQPTTGRVDLNDAAREVLALSSSELHRTRVILRSEFDPNLPTVRGDRVQLQQVMLNLILNAADAMRAIDDRPRDLLVATGHKNCKDVRFSVTDTGTGIDSQNIEQLFSAFYTTKSHGMGVGLSISRTIIESHAGRLWATANDEHGATFSFSIPSF